MKATGPGMEAPKGQRKGFLWEDGKVHPEPPPSSMPIEVVPPGTSGWWCHRCFAVVDVGEIELIASETEALQRGRHRKCAGNAQYVPIITVDRMAPQVSLPESEGKAPIAPDFAFTDRVRLRAQALDFALRGAHVLNARPGSGAELLKEAELIEAWLVKP